MNERTLKVILALSLVANLFLVGALVGGATWIKSRPGMINAGSLRVAGAELPRNERRAFRSALHEARQSMMPTIKDGRKAREQAASLLGQPQLDQVALRAALARIRADDLTVRAGVEERAIVFAATLPPSDRARLAQALIARDERQVRRK